MSTPITLANGRDAYTTRDGREVWLLGIDGRNISYPVVGEILKCGDWHLEQWTATGHPFSGIEHERSTDLIPKPVRHKREVWVNVYRDTVVNAWRCKEAADDCSRFGRIACIPITIEYTDGEGLQ